MGYVNFKINAQTIVITPGVTPTYTNVALDHLGFVNFALGTSVTDAGKDYYIQDLGGGSIKITFINTNAAPSVKDYAQYRRFKMFNRLIDLIDSPNKNKMTMLINYTTGEKRSLSSMTISDIVTSSTQHKSFTLNTGLTTAALTDVLAGFLVFYTEDNEFIILSLIHI